MGHFYFGDFSRKWVNIQPALTSEQLELSDTMIGYWTQFAKTLNPNSPAAPKWTKYSAGGSLESLVSPTPGDRVGCGI
jgi:carboxylesterase type B